MSSQPPAQSSEKKELVKFLPFKSTAPPSFWLNHNERKLNDLKLSEEGVPLVGYFAPSSNKGATIGNVTSKVGTPMQFDSSATSTTNSNRDDTSNDEDSSTATTNQDDTASESIRRNEYIKSTVSIYSLNTLESFKTINKNEFLNENCLPALLKCCGIVGNNQLKQDDASNSSSVRSGSMNVEEDYEGSEEEIDETRAESDEDSYYDDEDEGEEEEEEGRI